jgi:hypothetical protein
MKQLIRWIVDFIISFLKDLVMKNHIEKLEKEVDDANKEADKDVERANESYHEFMSYYSDYQSDLKRRGVSTMQPNSGEVRKSSKGPEEGDRQSEGSDKKTKRLD